MLPRPTRRAFIGAAALAPALGLAAWRPVREGLPLDPPPVKTATLADAASAQGRYFGAAVRAEQLRQNAELRGAVLRDCQVLTPEIHLKWNSLEWRKGEFNFAPVDDLLDFSQSHGMQVRGHTLLWDQGTPDWARQEMLRRRDWSLMSGHLERVLKRYGDRIADWDVINEPIDTQGGAGGLRRNVFHRAFGPTYIERVLEEARALAPKAHLVVNDYGFEYDNPVDQARRKAIVALARRLRASGTPLDGIGVQAHLDLSKEPLAADGLRDMTQQLVDLGLEITITELDVKESSFHGTAAARDQKVADETRRYLETMLAFTQVRGVVTWGLSDRHSWLSEPPQRQYADAPPNRGLPYDVDYRPKPMYHALSEALRLSA